jgi:hypothetical protein
MSEVITLTLEGILWKRLQIFLASMLGGSARFAVGLAAIAYANMPIVVQQLVLSVKSIF